MPVRSLNEIANLLLLAVVVPLDLTFWFAGERARTWGLVLVIYDLLCNHDATRLEEAAFVSRKGILPIGHGYVLVWGRNDALVARDSLCEGNVFLLVPLCARHAQFREHELRRAVLAEAKHCAARAGVYDIL